jgi:glycosyltransferase involved in cell wall biosynthesis
MAQPLVLIPTYNERDNLIPFIQAVRTALPEADLLIIDDNSPDGTGKLADTCASENPGVDVLITAPLVPSLMLLGVLMDLRVRHHRRLQRQGDNPCQGDTPSLHESCMIGAPF